MAGSHAFCVAARGESVQPGVAVATGIYWNKLSRGGSNVNGTTSSALSDMGGGATFFDNLVEVRAAELPAELTHGNGDLQ